MSIHRRASWQFPRTKWWRLDYRTRLRWSLALVLVLSSSDLALQAQDTANNVDVYYAWLDLTPGQEVAAFAFFHPEQPNVPQVGVARPSKIVDGDSRLSRAIPRLWEIVGPEESSAMVQGFRELLDRHDERAQPFVLHGEPYGANLHYVPLWNGNLPSEQVEQFFYLGGRLTEGREVVDRARFWDIRDETESSTLRLGLFGDLLLVDASQERSLAEGILIDLLRELYATEVRQQIVPKEAYLEGCQSLSESVEGLRQKPLSDPAGITRRRLLREKILEIEEQALSIESIGMIFAMKNPSIFRRALDVSIKGSEGLKLASRMSRFSVDIAPCGEFTVELLNPDSVPMEADASLLPNEARIVLAPIRNIDRLQLQLVTVLHDGASRLRVRIHRAGTVGTWFLKNWPFLIFWIITAVVLFFLWRVLLEKGLPSPWRTGTEVPSSPQDLRELSPRELEKSSQFPNGNASGNLRPEQQISRREEQIVEYLAVEDLPDPHRLILKLRYPEDQVSKFISEKMSDELRSKLRLVADVSAADVDRLAESISRVMEESPLVTAEDVARGSRLPRSSSVRVISDSTVRLFPVNKSYFEESFEHAISWSVDRPLVREDGADIDEIIRLRGSDITKPELLVVGISGRRHPVDKEIWEHLDESIKVKLRRYQSKPSVSRFALFLRRNLLAKVMNKVLLRASIATAAGVSLKTEVRPALRHVLGRGERKLLNWCILDWRYRGVFRSKPEVEIELRKAIDRKRLRREHITALNILIRKLRDRPDVVSTNLWGLLPRDLQAQIANALPSDEEQLDIDLEALCHELNRIINLEKFEREQTQGLTKEAIGLLRVVPDDEALRAVNLAIFATALPGLIGRRSFAVNFITVYMINEPYSLVRGLQKASGWNFECVRKRISDDIRQRVDNFDLFLPLQEEGQGEIADIKSELVREFNIIISRDRLVSQEEIEFDLVAFPQGILNASSVLGQSDQEWNRRVFLSAFRKQIRAEVNEEDPAEHENLARTLEFERSDLQRPVQIAGEILASRGNVLQEVGLSRLIWESLGQSAAARIEKRMEAVKRCEDLGFPVRDIFEPILTSLLRGVLFRILTRVGYARRLFRNCKSSLGLIERDLEGPLIEALNQDLNDAGVLIFARRFHELAFSGWLRARKEVSVSLDMLVGSQPGSRGELSVSALYDVESLLALLKDDRLRSESLFFSRLCGRLSPDFRSNILSSFPRRNIVPQDLLVALIRELNKVIYTVPTVELYQNFPPRDSNEQAWRLRHPVPFSAVNPEANFSVLVEALPGVSRSPVPNSSNLISEGAYSSSQDLGQVEKNEALGMDQSVLDEAKNAEEEEGWGEPSENSVPGFDAISVQEEDEEAEAEISLLQVKLQRWHDAFSSQGENPEKIALGHEQERAWTETLARSACDLVDTLAGRSIAESVGFRSAVMGKDAALLSKAEDELKGTVSKHSKEPSGIRVERDSFLIERDRPQLASVHRVIESLGAIGSALAELAQNEVDFDGVLLAGTELETASLASRVAENRQLMEKAWRSKLREEAKGVEGDLGRVEDHKVLKNFLNEGLLAVESEKLFGLLMRLDRISEDYCKDSADEMAKAFHRETALYRERVLVFRRDFADVGVSIARLKFLQAVPPDWEFREQSGSPLFFKSSRLEAVAKQKAGFSGRDLSRTVVDVSTWGYRCDAFPEFDRPTTGYVLENW